MRRWLIAILLLLTTTIAFAGPLSDSKDFSQTLTPTESDYSVGYLNQVFGTVGNVLPGTGNQILGKMFEIFNKGVLVVAAIWLLLTIIQMAVRAAQDGSFLGQNKNGVFVALRIAIGFALIIPSSTTGYSLLQNLFMKIVVHGVGLADQVWDTALDYLQYGGQLYINPKTINDDPNIIKNFVATVQTDQTRMSCTKGGDLDLACGIPAPETKNSFPKLAPVAMLFVDEVCMYRSSSSSWNPSSTADDSGEKSLLPTIILQNSPVYNEDAGVINFPPMMGSKDEVRTPQCGSITSNFCGNHSGLCKVDSHGKPVCTKDSDGKPVLSNIFCLEPNKANDRLRNEARTSYAAMKQMVEVLLPAAKNYADSLEPSGNPPATNSGDAGVTSDAKIAFNAILGYVNLIKPYQSMLALEDNTGTDFVSTVTRTIDTGGRAFIDKAKAQGWIMAGGFYRNIQMVNNVSAKQNVSELGPTANPPNASVLDITDAASDLTGAAKLMAVTNVDMLNTLWGKYVGAVQNNVIDTGSSGGGSNVADSMTSYGVLSIADSFKLGSEYNPIVSLMNLGKNLLIAVTVMWTVAMVLSVVVAAFAGICNSTSSSGLVLQMVMTWLKSIMMLISGLLLAPGCILSYYVPFYPFMVFTFTAVGWIVLVIEGMAAAPLVCVGITHPEGHDFLGKGEQALMLFLGIFLRPSLMIIGLIAAMLVSFVAFQMLISGFGQLFGVMLADSNSAMNQGFLSLISMCLLLVVFGFMVMELIEQCYKLIYQLPNYILKWIGGPQSTGEEYGQMASQLKGAVSSGAGALGEGMKGMDSANSAAGKTAAKARAKHGGGLGGQGKGNLEWTKGGGGGSGGNPTVNTDKK